MINGIQALLYSKNADELGLFFQEKLGLKTIDNKNGCLVFDTPGTRVVSHPSLDRKGTANGTNLISFCCDNIEETVNELKEKGVQFKGEILDYGYGQTILFKVPGDFYVQLLEV